MDKVRQSNYELMRILLMFMVIFWHMIVNIVFGCNITKSSSILWQFLHFLLEIHINAFILLTGYFQCKKEKIEISKVLKINNQAYFYKIVFLIFFLSFSIIPLTRVEIFWAIQPITLFKQYWYISIYLMLHMVSPFLNVLLNTLSRKSHFQLITILFFTSSILPCFTKELVFNNNKGFSLLNFILLYIIGAYLRKYPIEKSYLFSKLTSNSRKILFIFIYFSLAFLNLLIFYFQIPLAETTNPLLNEIASIIDNMHIAYNNPILILQAIFFFLYFGELKIYSKIINFISIRTLDIYLIHDNYLLRGTIYQPILLFLKNAKLDFKAIFMFFLVSIAIFITCFIIGLIRELLFKIFCSLPIAKKIQKSLQNKIKCFGFSI